MFALLHSWKSSLELIRPAYFKSFTTSFLKTFLTSTKLLFKGFGWLLLGDFLGFFAFGDSMLNALKTKTDGTIALESSKLLIFLITSMVWFVLNTAYLLFIRRKNSDSDGDIMGYFKATFSRYIQIAFLFLFIFSFSVMIILGMGITKFPKPHWTLLFSINTVQLLTIFYWLDSRFQFKDIFLSIEKTINFIVYNLPILLVLLMLAVGMNMLTNVIIFGFGGLGFDQISLGTKFSQLMEESFSSLSLYSIMFLKYLKFFGDYFWISILFTVYKRKKEVLYTGSFFQ